MDILRILAAFWVVVMHSYALFYPSNAAKAFHYGHAAVIVFFVLSGFVIAYTTRIKNTGPKQYWTARFSRLYSVLIPALIFTYLCSILLQHINSAAYDALQRGNPIIRYLISLTFTNEFWFLSAAPPINAPLWSLSFEFAYYVIFGLFIFRKEIKYSKFLLALALLVVGPKILLLMPIWLMGVLIMYLPSVKLNSVLALSLSLIFFLLGIGLVVYLDTYPYTLGTPPYYFAAGFITDWLIGICFMLCLWLFPDGTRIIRSKNLYYGYFRKFADTTFAIYVLHNPLLKITNELLVRSSSNFYNFELSLLIVFGITILLGWQIEKCRPLFNRFFNSISDTISY